VLPDQLDRDAHVRQVAPVPISSDGGHLETSGEGQAGAVAKRQSLSLGSGSKVGSLGGIVLGERLDFQSAFSGLVDRSSATTAGWPCSASFAKTSERLTALIAAPAAIASTTSSAPFSSCSRAGRAEASMTDAGASPFGTLLLGLLLGASFGSPLGDQLVSQANARGKMGKHAPSPLGGCTPLSG
jgi:hypothetical protein